MVSEKHCHIIDKTMGLHRASGGNANLAQSINAHTGSIDERMKARGQTHTHTPNIIQLVLQCNKLWY